LVHLPRGDDAPQTYQEALKNLLTGLPPDYVAGVPLCNEEWTNDQVAVVHQELAAVVADRWLAFKSPLDEFFRGRLKIYRELRPNQRVVVSAMMICEAYREARGLNARSLDEIVPELGAELRRRERQD
jgi:hypothetical protein